MSRIERNNRLPSFAVAKNTFIKEKVADKARRIEIEIGDEKEPERFLPQFKTKHWDNETNLSVRLKDDDYGRGTLSTRNRNVKDVVEWARAGRTARIYELDGFEDGGVEFEVELDAKPASNVIEFTIRTKGFDFFYQPPLTPEEIEQGAHRPENVIGSYAVYHKTKRDNQVGGKHYRTGKAFHIYRPHAVDAAGNETWCELDMNERDELLTVTVPQEFLDKAVYPVIVDPTFGYTSIGSSNPGWSGGNILALLATAPEGGTLDSLHAYVAGQAGSVADMKMAMYRVSDLSFVTESDTSQVRAAANPLAWKVFTPSGSPAISSSADYLLAVWLDDPTRFAQDVGAGTMYTASASYGGSFPSVFDTDFTFGNAYSIYATYTASGGGGTETGDARAAEASGAGAATASRGAETGGSEGATSSRGSEISGVAAADDARNAGAVGSAEGAAARAVEVTGANDHTAGRSAEISGSASVAIGRAAGLSGIDTAAVARAAETTGSLPANDERSGLVHGTVVTSAQRLVEAHGAVIVEAERPADVHGADESAAERPAAIRGSQMSANARSADATGVAAKGADRASEVRGQGSADSTRSAEVDAADGAFSFRGGALEGDSNNLSDRLVELHGVATELSTRAAEASGERTGNAQRSAVAHGTASADASRVAEASGSLEGTANRSAKVSGQDDVASTVAAEIVGGVGDSSSRSAEVVGDDAATAHAIRSAYITGAPFDPYCPKPSPYSAKTNVYTPYPPRSC